MSLKDLLGKKKYEEYLNSLAQSYPEMCKQHRKFEESIRSIKA